MPSNNDKCTECANRGDLHSCTGCYCNSHFQSKRRILVLDPGRATGWCIWDQKPIASGCIHVYSNKAINPLTQLETKLKKILKRYKPEKAWIEKQYTFRRRYRNKQGRMVTTDGGSQAYASYWNLIYKVLQDVDIPVEILDTTKLARNITAVDRAKNLGLTKKRRISPDEAETIMWALYLQQTGQLEEIK